MKILIVVDMQNDFIDGALGSPDAVAIVEPLAKYISEFSGICIFTRDTHKADYMQTREGKRLPVPHCIEGEDGWQISEKIAIPEDAIIINKETFGSTELIPLLLSLDSAERIESVELAGLCTDICVISNAFIVKAALPECDVSVHASLSAGVSRESHERALSAMRACQIDII